MGADISGKLSEFPAGITAIDTDYVRPRLAASHLVVDGGRAAFVDTGTTLGVPNLLSALALKGVDPADVDWVLTTHVHLDHAGGAGELMRHLPNARCAIHPRGARHLAEPSKLIAGSIAVYGEARYRELYGADRGGRVLVAGKASAYASAAAARTDPHAGSCAAPLRIVDQDHGDFLRRYLRHLPGLRRGRPRFIMPTTTPVHFDPEALCASVGQ
jgi:glyoxylase-like metal-dependent hydrolase (beta-lactamase superfamily II)